MSASQLEYKNLIREIYEKKVLACVECKGLNPTCACMQKFNKLVAIASAKIPYKYRYAKIQSYLSAEEVDQHKKAEKYATYVKEMRQQGIGLALSGTPDSNKTFIICGILIRAIEQNMTGFYLDVNDFYRIHELRYSDRSDRYHQQMGKFYDVDFLAVDGLSAVFNTGKPAAKQELINLFQERILANKPTILGLCLDSIKSLQHVSPELHRLAATGCPIEIELKTNEFASLDINKKKSIFDNLPDEK